MSKRALDTTRRCISPFLQMRKGMANALIHLFLCATGGRFGFWSKQVASHSCGSVHLPSMGNRSMFFFHEIYQVEKTVAMTVGRSHTTQTICSLFKHPLCFKFHHSCNNTHAQTVLVVLTNLPVWRWLTGVFNYADCTSSMWNIYACLINIMSELKVGQTLHPVTR